MNGYKLILKKYIIYSIWRVEQLAIWEEHFQNDGFDQLKKMVNKPKNKIVTHQCSSQEQIKRRSGKPKGVKQNILPSSGQLEDLIIIIIQELNQRILPLRKQLKFVEDTRNFRAIQSISSILSRSNRIQINYMKKWTPNGNEINRTLIEKLGQLLEISFLKEMIYYIRLRPEEPFQLFQGGGLQKQFQVVQANFVKYLDTKCVGQENIDIQTEFEIFKTSIDTKNIEQDYKEIANHFKNQELFLK
ncbi:hypothetical protein pb186bvf_000540 [Paramecium bursaria]